MDFVIYGLLKFLSATFAVICGEDIAGVNCDFLAIVIPSMFVNMPTEF